MVVFIVPLMSSGVTPEPRKFPATSVFVKVMAVTAVVLLRKIPPPGSPPLSFESERLLVMVTLVKVAVPEVDNLPL